MRISRARAHLVETEPGIRLATRYGGPPARRGHVLVELHTDEGLVGWGEASPLPYFTGETPETVHLILERHFLPRLVGEDPWEGARIHRALAEGLAANAAARCAVDAALHDLRARAAGLPLYRLLGGPVADTLPRTYPMSIEGAAEAAAAAKAWVGRGYRTLKIKVGGGVGGDVERVTAVRDAVGADVRIRIDANAGYALREARELARALRPVGLEAFEQPIAAGDLEAWRTLRRAVDVPLMADESLHTPEDALALAREHLADFVVVKLIKTGGIEGARRVAAVCQAGGIECIFSTPFDTPVGATTVVHAAFALGSVAHAHDLAPVAAETARVPGRVAPPQGPGIGVAGLPSAEVSWSPD
jgi:L-alanine-DL-glutamate epimerase-like enolase superfamily enzyme